jgi:hypothetical protein
VKLPDGEVDYPFPFGAEVNIAWRCALTTSVPLIVTLMSQIFLKLNEGVRACLCVCFCVFVTSRASESALAGKCTESVYS